MNMSILEIKNLHARVSNHEILKGVNLTVNPGEVHSIMGPNGSGKSTLAQVLAGLQPKPALRYETGCGLDIDALKIAARGADAMRSADCALLLITHYQRLLNYVVPDYVHVLVDGRIVKSGGPELALELEEKGY